MKHPIRAWKWSVLAMALPLVVTATAFATGEDGEHRPNPPPWLSQFEAQGGEAVYQSICQGCHMADARGAEGAGAYPALADNPRLAASAYAIHRVLKGQGAMPPFETRLSDQQVADVVNFVRSHFGNQYPDTVNAVDVGKLR